jgi:hypothetical protein
MTIGPENLGNGGNGGNGAAKTEERFAGQLGYRPRGNRDGGPMPVSPLSGTPMNGGSHSNGPLGGPFSGGHLDSDELGPRNGSAIDRITTALDIANPIASTLTQPKLAETALADLREPALGGLGYGESGFRDPVGDSWLDPAMNSVVNHPLLRGLLLELPPKGSTLQAQWLDRWFEAARSILELLYRFEDSRD